MTGGFSERGLLVSYPHYQDPDPLLVDVGAHQGGFARPFARLGWRVLALEPEPQNLAACRQALAPFPRARCLDRVIADRPRRNVPFYVSREHYGIHSLRPFHPSHRPAFPVDTSTLDQVLAQQGVERITLLKIDIEGADYLALQGLDLERFRPRLVMAEFMDQRTQPHFGYNHHHMADYMAARGYQALVSEWAPIESYARQGEKGEPHTWLCCRPYPLDHEPAWGNLIFLPREQMPRFRRFLNSYLASRGLGEEA